jgi:hypothetical protein
MALKQRTSVGDIIWGSPEKFSLENRILNIVCFQVIICLIIATAVNVLLKNPINQTIGSVSIFFLVTVFYFASRLLKIYLFTALLGIIAALFLTAFFWFGSGGIVGSWPYALFILMVATVIVVPPRYKPLIIISEFLVFLSLFLMEYAKPSRVVHYHSFQQQFFDMAMFLFTSLFIVTTIVYIVFMQYIREKKEKDTLLGQTIKDKEELEKAFLEIKQLQGIIPICSACNRVRNDKGYWEQVEQYLHDRSKARFSHGFCPECAIKLKNNEVPDSPY